MSSVLSITDVPIDCLTEVLYFLPMSKLVYGVRLVCRKFHQSVSRLLAVTKEFSWKAVECSSAQPKFRVLAVWFLYLPMFRSLRVFDITRVDCRGIVARKDWTIVSGECQVFPDSLETIRFDFAFGVATNFVESIEKYHSARIREIVVVLPQSCSSYDREPCLAYMSYSQRLVERVSSWPLLSCLEIQNPFAGFQSMVSNSSDERLVSKVEQDPSAFPSLVRLSISGCFILARLSRTTLAERVETLVFEGSDNWTVGFDTFATDWQLFPRLSCLSMRNLVFADFLTRQSREQIVDFIHLHESTLRRLEFVNASFRDTTYTFIPLFTSASLLETIVLTNISFKKPEFCQRLMEELQVHLPTVRCTWSRT